MWQQLALVNRPTKVYFLSDWFYIWLIVCSNINLLAADQQLWIADCCPHYLWYGTKGLWVISGGKIGPITHLSIHIISFPFQYNCSSCINITYMDIKYIQICCLSFCPSSVFFHTFYRFHDTYARSFVDIYKICIKIFVTDRITTFHDYTEQRVIERICFDTQR